jgi:hypothetical protein
MSKAIISALRLFSLPFDAVIKVLDNHSECTQFVFVDFYRTLQLSLSK